MFVGNNWDGTADVIRSTGDLAGIGRVNVVPDKDQRLTEIYLNPVKLAYFLGVRLGPGEGHDQFVDDMYSTPDGSAVVVSRPSFADVVSIDLATGRINWRFPVSGYRSDHMALSPDGTRVAVSASTSNTVHVLDVRTGAQLGSFSTGDKPHENLFTDGGRRIWNMSIGEVNTALDAPWLDWTKGDRRITVVDADTFAPVRVIDMRERLDAMRPLGPLRRDPPGGVHPGRVDALLPGVLLQRPGRVRRRRRPDHPGQDPAEEPRDQRGPHHLGQRLAPPRPVDEPGR